MNEDTSECVDPTGEEKSESVVPQVGDRVVVDVDAERFEGPFNVAYFEEELEARGLRKPFEWCLGCTTNERGHIIARFPHRKRNDQMLVFVVNVDGRGIIAISAKGIKARLWCGAKVQVIPRVSRDMRLWRAAALCLFKSVTTVPADDVARCVGITEACLPHPHAKYQFVWLVKLVDAENVYTLAHSIDLRPWTESKRRNVKHARQLVVMVPASSHLRPMSASFAFQGVGSAAMTLSVDTDDGFLRRQLTNPCSLDNTPYLQKFFLPVSDENVDYS